MNEQEVGASFPIQGVDVTSEFGRQPADTTPQAANVRAFETLAERLRGGSRPGLSKHVEETIVGDYLVQHLAILVDPQNPALSAEVDEGDYLDPSTNNTAQRNFGRLIRRGGSGRMPNRNDPRENGEIALVQSKTQVFSSSTSGIEITLDSQPELGNHIVVFAHANIGNGNLTVDNNNFVSGYLTVGDVRNGGNGSYTQVGGGGYVSQWTRLQSQIVLGSPKEYNSLAAFYLKANAGVADQTILIQSPADTSIVTVGSQTHLKTIVVHVGEFRNLANAGPLNATHGEASNPGASELSPGLIIGTASAKKAFFHFYLADRNLPSGTVPSGTFAPSGFLQIGGVSNSNAKYLKSTETELTPVFTPTSGSVIFGSIGFSWNKK